MRLGLGLAALLLCGAAALGQDSAPAEPFSAANISRLVPKFTVVLGGAVEGAGHYRHVSSHAYLPSGHFLFTIDGWGGIAKLDLSRKGARVWYSELGRRNIDAWLQASRGMALDFDGATLFAAGSDGLLHWIDTETGETLRSVAAGDPLTGFEVVAAPLVTDRLVIVAGSGDDRVGPLKFLAYDKASGEPVWDAELGELSGLSAVVRQSGLIDSERGQVIWPFTFPALALPEIERQAWAGNGVVALDLETGELRWTHRTPPPADALPENGPVQLLPDGSRLLQFKGDGSMEVLDAATGQPLLNSSIYGADPKLVAFAAGEVADALQVTPPSETCENAWSVIGYGSAVSARTGLAYGANANACATGVGHIVTPQKQSNWLGAYYAGHDASLGLLTAMDVATGEIVAQRLFPAPLVGGAALAGDGLLVVTSADGGVYFLKEDTLEPVGSRQLAAVASVEPTLFELDGQQVLALAVGGDAISPYLAYRSPDLSMSEGLLVLVVMGVKEQ